MTTRRRRSRRRSRSNALPVMLAAAFGVGMILLLARAAYLWIVAHADAIINYLTNWAIWFVILAVGAYLLRILAIGLIVAYRQAVLNYRMTGKLHIWRGYDV